MSNFMLDDKNLNDVVNPFVTHDFSLPGSVRQTGVFSNFSTKKAENEVFTTEKSVFCDYGLCKDANEPRKIKQKATIDSVDHVTAKTFKFIVLLLISVILYFLLP